VRENNECWTLESKNTLPWVVESASSSGDESHASNLVLGTGHDAETWCAGKQKLSGPRKKTGLPNQDPQASPDFRAQSKARQAWRRDTQTPDFGHEARSTILLGARTQSSGTGFSFDFSRAPTQPLRRERPATPPASRRARCFKSKGIGSSDTRAWRACGHGRSALGLAGVQLWFVFEGTMRKLGMRNLKAEIHAALHTAADCWMERVL
jgi:hypothetical protein